MPRAVICSRNGPYTETLQLAEVPPINFLPDKTLKVRVACAGLSFPDLLQVEGKYQIPLKAPYVPVLEIAGEVTAIGPGVNLDSAVVVGDRIAGWAALGQNGHLCGGLGEEALVNADRYMRLPEGVSYEAAVALLRNYTVVHHALCEVGKLQPGETLLVLGAAGACGLCAIDLGKALGATVVACASSASKLDACKAAGADIVVDYEDGHQEGFLARLREAKVYRKANVIFDPVGGKYAEAAFRALATLGRFVIFGFASGSTNPKSAFPNLPLNLALMRGQQILGSVTYAELISRGESIPASIKITDPMPEMLNMVQTGRLKPFLSKTYPLEDFKKAFDDLASRKAIGKVIVSVGAKDVPAAKL